MKNLYFTALFAGVQLLNASGFYAAYPNAPAAGQPDSTAIHLSDSGFTAWADGYTNVLYGSHVDAGWQTPAKALGQAVGDSGDIVCLGRGGQITMTFSQGITDGPGADFAVFENGVSDGFLEMGWVEVSSDGIHFTRFPNYSLTASAIGAYGSMDPKKIYGMAGKYRQGYGMPFDLSELRAAYDDAIAGNTDFDLAFTVQLTNNLPLLDTNQVTHVRIVDIVGDGTTAFDARGLQIYDPYPTTGSAGFDLDAVGVINQPTPDGLPQQILFASIPHQKLAFGSLRLQASTDSGLSVFFAVQSGPGALDGDLLTFTGTGVVEVVAIQPGDETYAPAAQKLQSFKVAEEIQHIFVEPVPNQLRSGALLQVNAYSSSGLPVLMEVYSGPAAVTIGPTNHVLELANEIGSVVLRAFQPGDASTAPAEEILIDFEIVDAGAGNAPITLVDWLASNSVPELAVESGTDAYGRSAVVLDFTVDRRVLAYSRIIESADLDVWSNAVPEILELETDSPGFIQMTVQLPADSGPQFYRLILEAQ